MVRYSPRGTEFRFDCDSELQNFCCWPRAGSFPVRTLLATRSVRRCHSVASSKVLLVSTHSSLVKPAVERPVRKKDRL